MKYLKRIIVPVLMVLVVSCEAWDRDYPFPIDEAMENTGAFLRVLSVETAAFDAGDLENAEYAFIGEVSDADNGQGVESVEFYVSYRDVDAENVISESELGLPPAKVYQVSDIAVHEESGLPRTRFSISLEEALDVVGLEASDLSVGDRFDIRIQLNMHDGRTFTNTDVGQGLSTPFYRSSLAAVANVVISLDPDSFVGSYTFTQVEASSDVTGAFSTGWLYEGSQTFDVTLSVNPDNELVGRNFTATPWPEYGIGPMTWSLEFALFTTLSSGQGIGLSCGNVIAYGTATDNRGSFDPFDDSEFTFVVNENINADCGFSGQEVIFTATKN
jgi:hypothetical protein